MLTTQVFFICFCSRWSLNFFVLSWPNQPLNDIRLLNIFFELLLLILINLLHVLNKCLLLRKLDKFISSNLAPALQNLPCQRLHNLVFLLVRMMRVTFILSYELSYVLFCWSEFHNFKGYCWNLENFKYLNDISILISLFLYKLFNLCQKVFQDICIYR